MTWTDGKCSLATSRLVSIPLLLRSGFSRSFYLYVKTETKRQRKTKSPAISSSFTRAPKPPKLRLSVQITPRPIQRVFKVDSAALSGSCHAPRYVGEFRMSRGFSKVSGAVILHLCMFQHPNDSSINGVLTGYRLYYRELPGNTSTFSEAEVQATKQNTTFALITSE